MSAFFITLIIIIIICLILVWYVNTYNKFQSFIIRINEVEANIDTTLRKRFDLLNKSINIIKGNINTEEDVLGLIVKLRSRKLSNFDLDRQLYEAINEFNYYKELLLDNFYDGHYKACKIFQYMVDHDCTLKDFHMMEFLYLKL